MVGSFSSRGLAGGVGSADADGIVFFDTTGLKVAASGLKEVDRCPDTRCFPSMLVFPPEVVDEMEAREMERSSVLLRIRCVVF
jgi:hypothetical protein